MKKCNQTENNSDHRDSCDNHFQFVRWEWIKNNNKKAN